MVLLYLLVSEDERIWEMRIIYRYLITVKSKCGTLNHSEKTLSSKTIYIGTMYLICGRKPSIYWLRCRFELLEYKKHL